MKIAVSGDWHIGPKRVGTRTRVLYDFADDVARRKVDLIVVPGDFYDAESSEDDRLFGRQLLERATIPCPVVLLGGNHDAEKDLLICDAFYSRHPIHVFDTPAAKDIQIGNTPLRVGCLPDLRGEYLAEQLGLLRKTMPNATVRDVALRILDQLHASMRAAVGPRLFVGHLTVTGARMDNDQPARSGELAFALAELKRVPADAYALGHIHLRQQWQLGEAPCFFTGSPYGVSYGDLGPKSYTLLHWTGKRFDVEIVPTKAPRLVLLTGTWQRHEGTGAMGLAYADDHETDLDVAIADLKGADVRLRYAMPLDDKDAAERAAADHVAAIVAAGAVACMPDPIRTVVTRSRAPALAGAKTTAAKLDAFWRATNTTPSPDRRERIMAILTRLEPQLPPPPPVSMVRVDELGWEGIGNLREAGELPMDRMGVQVVLGPNRAGKSTLLSSTTGALWVDGSKGMIDKLGKGKRARLRIGVTTATGSHVIEQRIARGMVSRSEGGVLAAETGREPYYAWAKKNLPKREMLERYCFAPPGKFLLLNLIDGDLKKALLGLAGSTQFEDLAKLVQKEGTELRGRAKALKAVLDVGGNPHASLAAARAQLTTTKADLTVFEVQREAGAAVLEARSDRRRVEASRVEAAAAAALIEQKRKRIAGQSSDAAAVEAATVALVGVREALAVELAAGQRLAAEDIAAVATIEDLQDQIERARSRAASETSRAERMEARLSRRAECLAAERALPAAVARLAAAESAVTTLIATPKDHRSALVEIRDVAATTTRVGAVDSDELGRRLTKVADIATEAIARDPNASKVELQSALAERDTSSRALSAAERVAGMLPELDGCEVERAAASVAADEEQIIAGLLVWRDEFARAHLEKIRAEATAANAAARRLEEEERRLVAEVASHPDAARAQGMLDMLRDQAAEAAAALAKVDGAAAAAQSKLDAARAALPPGLAEPTTEGQRTLAASILAAQKSIARLEEACSRHEDEARTYDATKAGLDLAERDLGDLTAFYRALDRNGIQAFEADAIGNEIADEATSLLDAHGFRWVIRYDPLRASGKQEIEQARWTVVNIDTGDEYDAREVGGGSSGGEETISGTAVFFGAGAAVVARGGGVKDATLTIDERPGAVRDELVEAWLAMLRDGAARVGAKVVYLVPPNDPRLIKACDGKILVTPTGSGSVVEQAA